MILQDTRDPLGGSNKMATEFKLLYERYKIYQENRCDLDSVIMDQAQRAVSSYKSKARLIKGNSSMMYRRMIHFISFHISEFVLA